MHCCLVVPLFFCLLLAMPGCAPEPASPALQAHLARHEKVRKKYFYQSIVRVVNTDRNPDFEKLIRDVRKITAYLPPREDSTYSVTALRPALREEGFETLLEARTKDSQRVSLWMKEWRDTENYLALVEAPEGHIILEIDGRLALEYLPSLTGSDQEAIRKLIMGQL